MYELKDVLRTYELFAMETERLRLAVLKRSCARNVADYLARNREFHRKWSQTHDDNYFTMWTQRDYLKYDAAEYHAGRLVPLYIMPKDEPGNIIGRVSFFNFAYGGMMSCSVGYHLDQNATGKGYMTEALKASCEMIMDIMKMHRIEAFILPNNERSLNLIKRCGFAYEGKRISYMHINGKWEDHEAFYLLSDNKIS
ncbi:MAG: GNAT family N-acetyltransferase [Clostridiales bacterium]|nr:GNAT family N-acetyltransferase [Clostridiales bacterium]